MDRDRRLLAVLLKAEGGRPELVGAGVRNSRMEIRTVPVLQFDFVDVDLLADHLGRPDEYAGIVLTSPRSAEAVAKASSIGAGLKLGWHDKACFVVGKATRDAARELLGWPDASISGEASGNAENLAEHILSSPLASPGPPSVSGQRRVLLFPCGNLKGDTLPTKVNGREGPVWVQPVTCYRTRESDTLSRDLVANCGGSSAGGGPRLAAVVFYSPSGVRFAMPHLKRIFRDIDPRPAAVAIGPTTLKALQDHGDVGACFGGAVIQCSEPTPEAVEAALDKVASSALGD